MWSAYSDYVHGDIRVTNIVFPSAEAEDGGVLIDFDLVREELTEYPSDYNDKLSERHPDAYAHQPMKKEHERHSLAVVIEIHV